MSPSGVAYADPITDPAEWTTFLAGHPELTAGTGVGGAVVASCTSVAACPVALGVGAFALSFVGTTAALNWAFGSAADNRTTVVPIGTGFGWFIGGTSPNLFGVPGTPPTLYPANTTNLQLLQTTAVTRYELVRFRCYNATTGVLGSWQAQSAPVQLSTANSGQNLPAANVACSGGAGFVAVDVSWHFGGNSTDTASTVTVAPTYWWHYDPTPNPPWTIVPSMKCKSNSTFAVTTVTGASVSLTPSANLSSSTALPPCPTGSSPLIGYITGGRPGDSPSQVIAAVPTTTTQTAPTPTPTPTPAGAPLPTAGPNPTGPSTGTGTSTPPTVDTTEGPSDFGHCLGGAWSWDPVNWVYVPVKCVMVWAFVPDSTQMQTDVNSVKAAFNGSAFGVASGAIGDIFGAVGNIVNPTGDCRGPAMPSVPSIGLTDASYPFSSCDEPQHTWAGIVKGVLAFVVFVAGGLMVVRLICRAFGWDVPFPRLFGGGDEQLALF